MLGELFIRQSSSLRLKLSILWNFINCVSVNDIVRFCSETKVCISFSANQRKQMAVLQCGYKVWPRFCMEKPEFQHLLKHTEHAHPTGVTSQSCCISMWLSSGKHLTEISIFLICQIFSTLKSMCELRFPLTNLPVVLSEWRKEKNPRHSILCVSSGLCRQLWNRSLVMWTVLSCRSEPYLVEAKLRDTVSLLGIVRSFQIASCF